MVIVRESRVICAVSVAVNERENPCPIGLSYDIKELCVKMSLNGMGLGAIERVTGISHNTVLNWVRLAAAQIPEENFDILKLLKLTNYRLSSAQKKTKFG